MKRVCRFTLYHIRYAFLRIITVLRMYMWPIVTERIAWFVYRSVSHSTSEPCKNSWNYGVAIWVEDSGGPKEPCITWGPDRPWEGAILRGNRRTILEYRDTQQSSVQKQLKRSMCHLGFWLAWAQGIVLDGGPDLPWEGAILVDRGTHCKV